MTKSGGAPPFPGSGLAELELLEEGDTSSNALRISGTAQPYYAGAIVTVFYGQSANAPAFAWTPDSIAGLSGWKVSEAATTNSAKWGTQFGVPLWQRLVAYSPLALRHRRYRYSAIVIRGSVGTGEAGIGLMEPVATGGPTGGEKGIALRSIDTLYGGAWHLAWRWYAADPLSVGPSSGIVPNGAPVQVEFDYRTGPVAASLVVTVNGAPVGTFTPATLPTLGADGSFVSGTPGFYSKMTGGGSSLLVACSRFRQERL